MCKYINAKNLKNIYIYISSIDYQDCGEANIGEDFAVACIVDVYVA